ncbi:hypothetical protein [Oribacterium sp. WCC10]|uniref:hypothetical protein n=1 Tax=Oribacterium sp. WCC10 TaxID=1855343 RepID=UPI0008E7BE2A|nr:hypothetical protein [Oribacterium sp. WCC10]SFG27387.1 hypothetical protein SAMN05216356_104196 [Oribacterium sp. WCC10]
MLEKKKDYIGTNYNCIGAIEEVLLIFSACTATYPEFIIPSTILRFIISLVAAIHLVLFISDLIRKPKYTKEDLVRDIEDLNMTERNSSIIAIQNKKHPTKYLLYSDHGWGLKLFPNFTTVKDDMNNIKRRLSEEFEIDTDNIHVDHKTAQHEIKFSTEHNEERSYNYTLYTAQIDGLGHEDEDSFVVAGKNYYWMTISEMLEDQTLKKHNEFVIAMVRDNA